MNRTGRAGGCPVTVTGAVAVVAALLLGGCHGGSQPPPAAGVGGGDRDPGQVCGSFAADRARHDTTTDTGPDEAHQRPRRWAHLELADNSLPDRQRQWALWTAHRVVVDVAVQPWAGDGLPADTDQRAYRAVVVSATPVGGDGWTGPTTRHTVYCTLGRAGGRWLVTGYQVDGGG